MPKILLIDDNADNLISLSATLKDFIPASTILTAISGPEGLKIASAELPDVIILDIRMPGMDGYEVLELLKANIKTQIIPIILLTANYADIKNKVRGLEAGADAFLSKPIDKNELIVQVKVMLRIKNVEDKLRKEKILLESAAKDTSVKFDFTQKKYQNIFNNNIAGIVETTFDGEILSCNNALVKILGFNSIEEVLEHKTIHFYKNVSDRNKIIALLKKNKKLLNYEVDFVDKNGKTINALIRCFNIGDQSILIFFIDITDIKKLQEKQNQYEHIVSSSSDMMALLDKNFTYLASNSSYLEAFDKTSEELIGFTIEDVFGKEFFESIIKPNALRCFSGEVINYQEWIDFPNKGKRYMDVGYSPYKDKQNKIRGFVVIARDITERKLTEKALRLREQQLSLIYDSTGDILYYLEVEPGPNYRFLTVNKTFLKATDMTLEQIVGKTINEVIPKPSLELVRSNYEKAIREKRIVYWEETSQYPSGLKTGIVSIAPVFNDKGNCTNLVGSVHDITERKQAEEELRESYNIINRSNAVVFLWKNLEGWPIEYVSQNVKDLFGYTAEEFLSGNVPYDSVVQQDDLKIAIEKASIYKKDKRSNEYTQEYRIITKDGKTKWVEDRTFIRRNEKGKITHFQGIVLDITEHKKNEVKIKQKSKQLLLLSKASTEINKVLDLEIILQQLVKIAIELTGSTSGAAALYEDYKMVFKTYNDEGKITPINFKFEKGYGVPGWVIKTKKPYITNDAKNDKHVIKEIRERLNFHQLIDTPILDRHGKLLGCFEIHNTKNNRLYDENDIELLKGLAANTAVAIENAQILLERKKTEEKLIASENKYRSLFENNSAGVFVSTIAGKILDCNEAFVSMLGYSSKEEVLKTDTINFYHNKEEREIFLKKLIAKKELINYESEPKRKDGSYIYIIENVQLIGENIIQGTVVDITNRKQAEEELKTKNRELQIFYDAAVGRELKVIELKKEINEQLEKSGKKPKYELPV